MNKMNKKIDMVIMGMALVATLMCAITIDGSRLAWGCCCIWILKSMILTVNR